MSGYLKTGFSADATQFVFTMYYSNGARRGWIYKSLDVCPNVSLASFPDRLNWTESNNIIHATSSNCSFDTPVSDLKMIDLPTTSSATDVVKQHPLFSLIVLVIVLLIVLYFITKW